MYRSSTLLLGILAAALTYAQPGTLVNSFGTNGVAGFNMPGVTHEFKAMAVQTNGKIVCVGYMQVNGQTDLLVARFLDNGSLDQTFGTGGYRTTNIMTGESFWAVTIQPDGKIVAAGLTFDSSDDKMIVTRYNPNGTLDASFGISGHALLDMGTTSDRLWSVAMQPDGKIVAAGNSFTATNDFDLALIRLTADGLLDNSFSSNGWTTLSLGNDCSARGVAVQADGKILVSGWGNSNGTYAAMLARYTTTGTLDAGFNSNGVVEFQPTATSEDEYFTVLVQNDQKIVAIGSTFDPEGDLMVSRYNSNGSLDPTFGTNGTIIHDIAGEFDKSFAGYLQSNGDIVVTGLNEMPSGDRQVFVTRITSNGSLDAGFGTNGVALINIGPENDVGLGCGMASDGDVLVAGFLGITGSYNAFVLRLDGSADVSVNEFTASLQVSAYPSPFTDRVILTVGSTNEATPKPEMHDALGHQVAVQVERLGDQEQGQQFLLTFPEELAPGIYSILIQSATTSALARVLKE